MATVYSPTPIPTTASAQATWATHVNTVHGMVTVRSAYDADGTQWTHRIPSFSQRGTVHTITAGVCDCLAAQHGRHCWHERAAKSAETCIHLILWDVLSYELCSWSSADAYGRGVATLEQMGIPTAGYWGSRDAAITAMEVLS
jgi:hypothetical protein